MTAPLPPDLAATARGDAGQGASTTLARAFKRGSTALKRGDLAPLDAIGQTGTTFATLDGAAVAVVPLDLYRQMVTALARNLGPAPRGHPAAGRAGRLSTIERDPEVAAFLRELFPRNHTVEHLRAACLERFGAERTPSRTRITLFRQRAT